jgi:hypothetical protein
MCRPLLEELGAEVVQPAVSASGVGEALDVGEGFHLAFVHVGDHRKGIVYREDRQSGVSRTCR